MAGKRSLKVAVLGPKGQCGSCVVDELLLQGHAVVGISRSPPKTWKNSENYSAVSADFNDINQLAKVMSAGYDSIVCAYGPPLDNIGAVYMECVETHCRIKSALLQSTHKGSFIIIGGAGSLHKKDGSSFADEHEFPYGACWPDKHLDYMYSRAKDHGSAFMARFIRQFKWARSNIENPGWFSWLFRPLALLTLRSIKKLMLKPETRGLILGSRVALHLWEGVTEKSWSFLSPPWLLRDKGIRTGKVEVFVDEPDKPAYQGIEAGVYNEDMAVAIVEEVEKNRLSFKHWTCTGPIGLKEW
nr:nad-dependent epimerase dehydratase [Colletotrichum truncatum]KAF6785921.1 nad-dependent epimerase dehydratase [Colletotrichum truncatum]